MRTDVREFSEANRSRTSSTATLATEAAPNVAVTDPALTHLLKLQRTVGNAATSRYLQQRGTSPVSEDKPASSQPASASDEPSVLAFNAHQQAVPPNNPTGQTAPDKQDLGAPTTLPHKAQLEAAFGQSLDHVRAHVGPEAQAAAQALGTEAFAVGPNIAFGQPNPSLEVVAHEVAHVVQHNGNGSDKESVVRPFGGPLSDPFEREADMAAHAVLNGDKPNVQLRDGEAKPRGYSGSGFLGAIANATKRHLFHRVARWVGYNPTTGEYEGSVPDVTELVVLFEFVGVLFDVNYLKSLDIDYLHSNIRVSGKNSTIRITSPNLRINDITNLKHFSSGPVEIKNLVVDVGVADLSGNYDVQVDHVLLHDPRFYVFSGDRATGQHIACDKAELSGVQVGVPKSLRDLFLTAKFSKVALSGLRYPGLPPVNLDINRGLVDLDYVGSVIGETKLPEAPDVGIPKDSRIDVQLIGPRVSARIDKSLAPDPSAQSGGFDFFNAKLLASDGSALASLTIEGFNARNDVQGNFAGSIDRLKVHGSGPLVKSLLRTHLVSAKAKHALDVIESAGIDLAAGVDVTIENIIGGKEKSLSTSKVGKLAASVNVPNLGTLDITLTGFYAHTGQRSENAVGGGFDDFTATLTNTTGKELAYLKIDNVGARGDSAALGGFVQANFVVRGDLGELVDTLKAHLLHLPQEIINVAPAISSLKLNARQISGTLIADAEKGAGFSVGGDLHLKLDADTTGSHVDLALTGLQVDSTESASHARFQSFDVKLMAGSKVAARIYAEGVSGARKEEQKVDHSYLKKSTHDEVVVKKLAVTGSSGKIHSLVKSLTKTTGSLPPKVQRICDQVAAYTISEGYATFTLTNAHVNVDETAQSGSLSANLKAQVGVPGVGTLGVAVKDLRAHGRLKGEKAVSFDRLELTLRRHKKEVAYFAAEGEPHANIESENEFSFKAKKIEARGDAKNIEKLADAAQKKLTILPPQVQAALATVAELDIRGRAGIALEDVDFEKQGDEIIAKGNLTANFAVPGVGKINIHVQDFAGEFGNGKKDVHFKSFQAKLSNPKGDKELASLAVQQGTNAKEQADAAHDAENPEIVEAGEIKNRIALIDALTRHVESLPAPVKAALAFARHALRGRSELAADVGETNIGKDSAHVSRADLSARVNLPGLGTAVIDVTGAAAASKHGTHIGAVQDFRLQLLDDQQVQLAELDVQGMRAEASDAETVFGADKVEVKGDGARILTVLEKHLDAFPEDIAKKLALIKEKRLLAGAIGASLKGLKVVDNQNGIAIDASEINLHGDFEFHGADERIYKAKNASIVATTAHLTLDAQHELVEVHAATMSAQGELTYAEPEGKIGAAKGTAALNTGPVTIRQANGRYIVVGEGIHATGDFKRLAPKDEGQHQSAEQSTDSSLSKADKLNAASLISAANIRTKTPMTAGRYGDASQYIELFAGTELYVDLAVKNNAILDVHVRVDPKPDFSKWDSTVEFGGVHTKVSGSTMRIVIEASNFADWAFVNLISPAITKYLLGKWFLPVNLRSLVQVVLNAGKDGSKSGKKTSDQKEKKPSLGDIVDAVQIRQTSGHGDATVFAGEDTKVAGVNIAGGSSIYLQGDAPSGQPDLLLAASANQLDVTAGDTRVKASGLDIQGVDTTWQLDRIAFKSFDIRRLELTLGGDKAKKEAAKK